MFRSAPTPYIFIPSKITVVVHSPTVSPGPSSPTTPTGSTPVNPRSSLTSLFGGHAKAPRVADSTSYQQLLRQQPTKSHV